MRGGTSRGLVFRREDLPSDRDAWDPIFLAAIGSPDVRELDGVGAGDSHTSKVAVVEPSPAPEADIDYLFGEVAITEPRVDYAANSGNIISALGLWAIEEGVVAPTPPETRVRVRNTNTGKLIELFVPCDEDGPLEDGDFSIDGVPGYGPRIDMVFSRPDGAVTGALSPAGAPTVELSVPGVGGVEASLVDAANPIVLVWGDALGVDPLTPVAELNADDGLRRRVQAIRSAAAVAMGLVDRPEDAWDYSPMIPFPVLVFPPSRYPSLPGAEVTAESMDLCVRVVSLDLFHKSINVTVSVAVTAAVLVPDTIAHRAAAGADPRAGLRIGHPSGVVHTRGEPTPGDRVEAVDWVRLGRTARRIMDGEVLVQPYKLRYLRELRAAGGA